MHCVVGRTPPWNAPQPQSGAVGGGHPSLQEAYLRERVAALEAEIQEVRHGKGAKAVDPQQVSM